MTPHDAGDRKSPRKVAIETLESMESSDDVDTEVIKFLDSLPRVGGNGNH